jgi:HK97 family phage major capsid protein/HK97 family phage prohead protease
MKTDLAALQRKLEGTKLQRALATVQRDAIDDASRTVEIAWASEQPYERWYGVEILDCAATSVRLGRLADGAALLFNHRTDALIGVVESVQVGSDRVCRAKVRFDTSPDAELRYQQVRNGVLRHVSVGYMVHRMVLEKEEKDVSTYRIDDWEPYELSMVTVPADPTVGVGRSADSTDPDPSTTTPPTLPAQAKETRAMDKTEDKTIEQQQQAPSADALDLKRRDALIELGVKYAEYLTLDDVQKACRDGHTVQKLQDLVIERMTTKHSDTRGAHIGLTDKEAGQYSIARAVAAMMTGNWKEAGLERDASEAAAKRFGMGTKGILIPFDIMARRDFTVGTASEAGNLVATQLRPDLFADVLRNRLALGRLGVTMLFGLTSNVDMPRKLSGSSLGYVTEVAASAETQPSTGKVTLSPKRIGGYIEFSKQAVIQSSLAIEPMLRQDILSEYQVNFENAAINGSGSGANPRGIRNTSGIGAVVGGTNGLALAWDHLVDLESACANVNAEPDSSSGYLINTKTRGKAKKTLKAAGLPFIWDNGAQPLNGYRAEVTNNVPSNLTKGSSSGICSSVIFGSNWPMLVMATFGAVELLVDETSIAINGMNRLILNGFVDVGCRRAADFASMEDALTT